MARDPPSAPTPGRGKPEDRDDSRINEFLRKMQEVQRKVTAYGYAAAGLDGQMDGILAKIRQQAAQATGYGLAAARPPPGVLEYGVRATQLPPEVLFRAPPAQGPNAWDRLDASTRAAARVAEEMEAAAGSSIDLAADWERQGYHFALSRVPGVARAWVVPMSLYNTTVTLAGFALARFALDDGWAAYLVQAEPGHEAVAVTRRAFLEEQCPGLRVHPAAAADLQRVLAGVTALWDRFGIPLQVSLSSPLAVNFQVMLRTLWNFVPEAASKDKRPALAEVWQKDPETGAWRQELGAPELEPESPAPEPGAGDGGAPGGD